MASDRLSILCEKKYPMYYAILEDNIDDVILLNNANLHLKYDPKDIETYYWHIVTWFLIEKAKSNRMIMLLFDIMPDKYKTSYVKTDYMLSHLPSMLFNRYAKEGNIELVKFFNSKKLLSYSLLDTRSVINSDNTEMMQLVLPEYQNDDFVHAVLHGKTNAIDYMEKKFPKICRIRNKEDLLRDIPWSSCPHNLIRDNNVKGILYYLKYMEPEMTDHEYFDFVDTAIENDKLECLKIIIENYETEREKKYVDIFNKEYYTTFSLRWKHSPPNVDSETFKYLYC